MGSVLARTFHKQTHLGSTWGVQSYHNRGGNICPRGTWLPQGALPAPWVSDPLPIKREAATAATGVPGNLL